MTDRDSLIAALERVTSASTYIRESGEILLSYRGSEAQKGEDHALLRQHIEALRAGWKLVPVQPRPKK